MKVVPFDRSRRALRDGNHGYVYFERFRAHLLVVDRNIFYTDYVFELSAPNSLLIDAKLLPFVESRRALRNGSAGSIYFLRFLFKYDKIS